MPKGYSGGKGLDTTTASWRTETIHAGSLELECLRRGSGPSLVVLHDLDYLNKPWPYLDRLAEDFSVVVPSHPGFGHSQRAESVDCVDDLAYVYLDLLRELDPCVVLGCGFGGWIAAEVAVRCEHSLSRLALVDALGIKVGGPTDRDIADVFLMDNESILEATWHDQSRGRETMTLPGPNVAEEDLVLLLRNRESAALYGWKPYMHNPKLLGRLKRIQKPTLVLWGAGDRIVSPDYGRAYAGAVPGARFAVIPQAGHYPYLEQPEAFLARLLPFLLENV